jgi:hypothetical protein
MTSPVDEFVDCSAPDKHERVESRTSEPSRRYRRVFKVVDLTDEEVARIARTEVPAEYAYLNELLKDWQP